MSRIAKAVALSVGAAASVAGAAGVAAADAGAHGAAVHSPGVLSGNVVQVPVHIPVNVCGNTVSVIGALNPAFAVCSPSDDSFGRTPVRRPVQRRTPLGGAGQEGGFTRTEAWRSVVLRLRSAIPAGTVAELLSDA